VVGTAVTCPFIRLHPAIVAQAAATVAALMPGRSFLGLGTGERLNEHVVGAEWPPPDERRSALEASIEAIRRLWAGREVTFASGGVHVEAARLYSLPEELPPIYVAAAGPKSATVAARRGDGLITTSPDAGLVSRYREEGGLGPVMGELTLCLAPSEDAAFATVRERWPLPGLQGDATTELPTPSAFARAPVDLGLLRERVVLGPDLGMILDAVSRYHEAGFTDVILHQVGDDQSGFLLTCEDRLLPLLHEAFPADESSSKGDGASLVPVPS
jgi:coenzyme F420-dependent glucose-6-phosphate dehydrogenase